MTRKAPDSTTAGQSRLSRSSIPELSLLQTFETVARHSSFTRAAEELFLTQSAVSRQVQALEHSLGLLLFKRRHRTVSLTDEGQKLLDVVGRSLNEIKTCLESLDASNRSLEITFSASVALAHFWLMPRLLQYRAMHPDVDLNVVAHDRAAIPRPGDADVAVLFGQGDWPGIEAELLFGECVYPVCSPSYLRGYPELSRPEQVMDHTLLHLDYGRTTWGSADWRGWFNEQGVAGPIKSRGIRFNAYPLVLQAAEAGQGVALGWSYITDPMVAAGRLVKPVDAVMKTRDGYYIATFDNGSRRPEVSDVVNWLKNDTVALPYLRMNTGNATHSE